MRRKIPFSRAKIVSLQFPHPKIRRILAETGRGAHEGRRLWRKQAVVSPMSKGGPLVRFAHIEGPKGWSGEHTEQSAVRSHGTPRKRSAERCEDAR